MSGAGDSGLAGRLVFAHTPAGEPVAQCEPADAYLSLGFAIAEECGGWERSLGTGDDGR
jgi:hypothetical protein